MSAMTWLLGTCREVSALVLRAEDRRLPLKQRLAIRLHLMACDNCVRFTRQVALMRQASATWRRYSESDPS